MASLVLGAAGAAMMGPMGFGFAGFMGLSGAQVGWMVGSSLGGMLGSDTMKAEGPRITDLKVQVSTYGAMRPIFYGTSRASGNVIWSSDLIETSNTESAGKGGPSQEVTTYSYAINCAVALGEGVITGVRRIWANGVLILDASNTNTGITGQSDNIRIYPGNETQTADPLLESYLGAGNVPGYRGTAYVVFENFQLADFGNRLPNFSFEVVQDGIIVAGNTVVMNSDNEYTFMIEHPYRSGVMLALLNKQPSGTGIDELHVLDYINHTVQVVSLGITGASGITYVSTMDQIWIATNNYNVSLSQYSVALALSAQTLAVVATINADANWNLVSGSKLAYDPLQDKVWFFTGTSTLGSNVNMMNPHDYTYVKTDVGGNMWFTANVAMGKTKIAAGRYDGGIWIFGSGQYLNTVATPSSGTDYRVYYDSLRNRFFYYSNTQEVKTIDEESYSVTTFPLTTSNFGGPSNLTMGYHSVYDKVFLSMQSGSSTYTLYQLNADDFSVENSWTIYETNTAPGITELRLTPEYVGLVRRDSSTMTSATLFPIVPRITSNQVGLSTIVADLCDRATLAASDIDVTQLTDMVDGYIISQQTTSRVAIENLMAAYYFDAVESS